jgi:hypothetical protein
MRQRFLTLAVFSVLTTLLCVGEGQATTVNYQGTLYGQFGSPVQGGRVIAGTFKPGFDTSNYSCTYGDPFCNTLPDNYSRAVADGNFIPLDSGVVTNISGVFSGSGTTSAAGSKIWFYGFTGSQPNAFDGLQVLATSSDFSYIVPASGTISVSATTANQFVYGLHFSNGFRVDGLPVPEPGTFGLAALSLSAMVALRRQRRLFARA